MRLNKLMKSVAVAAIAVAALATVGEAEARTKMKIHSAFGRNIFDTRKELTYIDFGPSFGGLTTANYIAPRTYGVTLRVRY